MESILDHRTCPKCPNLIAGADPHPFCFSCMGPDHAVSGMGPGPGPDPACQMIPRLTQQHRGEHFLKSEARQEEPEDQDLNFIKMAESGDEETPFRFSLPWGQMTPIPEEEDDEDDEDASLSGGPTLRSARMDFPAVMTLAAERVGLPLPPPLPPRPVSRLRQGFYGLVHPAQPTFVSRQLPDIWHCVAGIIKVQGCSVTVCPGVPPLDESLAAHLLPRAAGWAEGKRPLPRDRDTLEYLDKIFKLGTQMAAADNNLGVLGVSLIPPQADAPALPSQDGSDYPRPMYLASSERIINIVHNKIES